VQAFRLHILFAKKKMADIEDDKSMSLENIAGASCFENTAHLAD
jgi:hypothetical protein